jgi:hypothetical protein
MTKKGLLFRPVWKFVDEFEGKSRKILEIVGGMMYAEFSSLQFYPRGAGNFQIFIKGG